MDAAAWDERYSKAELEWGAAPNRFLVEEIGDRSPGLALDLGAGEGRNAIWLAEQGWEVTAVDFSEAGIDKGRRVALEKGLSIRWAVEDVLAFEAHSRFDLVIIFYVHLLPNERRRLMSGAAKALKPGGTVLIVGHDRTNLTEGTGGPRDPDILLDPTETAAELTGLTIVKAERVRRTVAGEDRDAIDTLVLGKRPHPAGSTEAASSA